MAYKKAGEYIRKTVFYHLVQAIEILQKQQYTLEEENVNLASMINKIIKDEKKVSDTKGYNELRRKILDEVKKEHEAELMLVKSKKRGSEEKMRSQILRQVKDDHSAELIVLTKELQEKDKKIELMREEMKDMKDKIDEFIVEEEKMKKKIEEFKKIQLLMESFNQK